MTLLLDYRTGSRELAFYEPVRSMLAVCSSCGGGTGEIKEETDKRTGRFKRFLAVGSCDSCQHTGRCLSDLAPENDSGDESRSSADLSFIGKSHNGPIKIGIEMKKIDELIGALQTGRLQATQLPSMCSLYDQVWILTYGEYRPSPEDGKSLQLYQSGKRDRKSGWYNYCYGSGGERAVLYSYVEAFLSGISLQSFAAPVFVKRTANIQEAAVWVSVLYNNWTKDPDSHTSMNVFDKSSRVSFIPTSRDSNTDNINRAARFAGLVLSGLGYKKAQLAAKHFGGSIKRMVNATAAEWASIKGIGPIIAKSIIREIDPTATEPIKSNPKKTSPLEDIL